MLRSFHLLVYDRSACPSVIYILFCRVKGGLACHLRVGAKAAQVGQERDCSGEHQNGALEKF